MSRTKVKVHVGGVSWRLSISLLLVLLGAFPCLSQTGVSAPLPPAAQEALNKGIIAAKMPDYLLAIRFFEEARKLAPEAPVIYLNMGLAESRIPGRELRAIAWFAAYLAAYPDAPNAEAVKGQIAVLEVKNQSNVSNFIKSVQAAAIQMSGYKKISALQRVAELWAKAGDITAALNTADLCDEGRDKGQSFAYATVSGVQAESGDIEGAQKTADMIAQQTGDMTPNDMERVRSYTVYSHLAIAEAQATADNFAGAQKTFDFALRTSEGIEASSRGQVLEQMVKSQARSGDITGAQKTVDLMPDDVFKKLARDFVAKFDAASTRKSKPLGQPAVKASNWLWRLDQTNPNNFLSDDVPLKYALFWDLAGHLKSLNASESRMRGDAFKPDEDKKIFDDLCTTAEQLISAQSAIGRMLKQQAGK